MQGIRGNEGQTLVSLIVSAVIASLVLFGLTRATTDILDRQFASQRKQEFSEIKAFMLDLIKDPLACKNSFTTPLPQNVSTVPGAATPISFNHLGAIIQDGVTLGGVHFDQVRFVYEGIFSASDNLHSAKFEIKATRVGGDPAILMNQYQESIPVIMEIEPATKKILSCGFTPSSTMPPPINAQALCNDIPSPVPNSSTKGIFGNLGMPGFYKEITSYSPSASNSPRCFNNSFLANDHIKVMQGGVFAHVMDPNPYTTFDKPESILYSKELVKVGGNLIFEYSALIHPAPYYVEDSQVAVSRPNQKFSPIAPMNQVGPDMVCFGTGPTLGCPEQRNNYFDCVWEGLIEGVDGKIKGTTTPMTIATSVCSAGKIRVGDYTDYTVTNSMVPGTPTVPRTITKTVNSVSIKPTSGIFTKGFLSSVAHCCRERP